MKEDLIEFMEALGEIESRNKPYAHIGMPQSTYSNTLIAIRAKTAKPCTIERFMKKFGYDKVQIEAQWKKK